MINSIITEKMISYIKDHMLAIFVSFMVCLIGFICVYQLKTIKKDVKRLGLKIENERKFLGNKIEMERKRLGRILENEKEYVTKVIDTEKRYLDEKLEAEKEARMLLMYKRLKKSNVTIPKQKIETPKNISKKNSPYMFYKYFSYPIIPRYQKVSKNVIRRMLDDIYIVAAGVSIKSQDNKQKFLQKQKKFYSKNRNIYYASTSYDLYSSIIKEKKYVYASDFISDSLIICFSKKNYRTYKKRKIRIVLNEKDFFYKKYKVVDCYIYKMNISEMIKKFELIDTLVLKHVGYEKI